MQFQHWRRVRHPIVDELSEDYNLAEESAIGMLIYFISMESKMLKSMQWLTDETLVVGCRFLSPSVNDAQLWSFSSNIRSSAGEVTPAMRQPVSIAYAMEKVFIRDCIDLKDILSLILPMDAFMRQ